MELRVFISSTFLDLEEERQHLTKKVFPAIRQQCRERGVEFTEIDLRWGLTEEEARLGKVIRTCLEEIDRCRPYFIGIMGSRYGWVPEFYEVQRDPELIRKYPWIEDSVADGKSLVEIEFEYGALTDPSSAENAFFYSRRRHQHDTVLKEDSERISALKERIRSSELPLREFSGPESLGEQIYDDLLAVIERNWKRSDELTPLERERREHESFAATRRHAYIANPKTFKALSDAAQKAKSVVVFGESGYGKSALLAHWSRHYSDRMPQVDVIEHYVGIGSGADHQSILTHLAEEIRERTKTKEPIPSEPERLSSDFAAWLARTGDTRTIIVIDALNQLDERSHHLGWLPEHLPENVTIVCSTTSAEMRDELVRRGFLLVEIAHLSKGEREAIIVRYLSEYHKALSVEHIERIAHDEKSASPLFLRTVLEELRTSANFEKLDRLIQHYMSVDSLDELFQRVLERMEEDYGTRTVRDVMGFLWASRRGLAEHELGEMIPISRVRLSSFLMALDYHLHRNEGILAFFHDYLRRAVEARYASSEAHQKKLHAEVARFMRTQPTNDRRASEEPWQWERVHDWEELRNTLVNIELFPYLAKKERQYELLGYWRTLKGKYDLAKEYDACLAKMKAENVSPALIREICHVLSDFLKVCGQYDAAEHVLMVSAECSLQLPLTEADHAEEQTLLADVYYYQSKYEKALILYEGIKEAYNRIYGASDKKTLFVKNSFGTISTLSGKVQEGIDILTDCLKDYQTFYPEAYLDIMGVLTNLGTAYNLQRNNTKALECIEESVKIVEMKEGVNSPGLILPLIGCGVMNRRLSKIEDAEKCYQRAYNISSKYLGHQHPSTARVLFNLAALNYFGKNNYELCIELCTKSFHIWKKALGITHKDTLLVLEFMGLQAEIVEIKNTALQLIDTTLQEIKATDIVSDEAVSILHDYKEKVQTSISKLSGTAFANDSISTITE